MKRIVLCGLAFSLFSMAALAETYSGTVVDVMCKGKDLSSHTKECALSCAKSGFGLVTADGKFLKFDEDGNAKALEAIKATDKEKDLKAKVTGEMDNDTLKVASIELE
ncbi:MAG TPA: hypothetical protein VN610_03945 [Bryobacteraceae bacterium]|nr:hypothetical protein [Bryobacteraceae bacterium]